MFVMKPPSDLLPSAQDLYPRDLISHEHISSVCLRQPIKKIVAGAAHVKSDCGRRGVRWKGQGLWGKTRAAPSSPRRRATESIETVSPLDPELKAAGHQFADMTLQESRVEVPMVRSETRDPATTLERRPTRATRTASRLRTSSLPVREVEQSMATVPMTMA